VIAPYAGGDRSYALGMDFGTQSVKTVVLDVAQAQALYADTFEYDDVLSSYGTRGGVLPAEDAATRHTSPAMLIEALDLAFGRLQKGGVPTDRIGAVKIDAMQHCTVYVDGSFRERIESLDLRQPLLPQLEPSLTRKTSPIWEDRSPVEEAAYLDSTLETHGTISALTGNRVELRFPAAQILRWACQSPDEYARTEHVLLLSAFMTSIVVGGVAPVDTGDGWGTNLNTIDTRGPGWSDVVLRAAEDYLGRLGLPPSLRDKLGEIVQFDTVVGSISPDFVQRYGFSPDTVVLAGTGDNPATLLGSGGRGVISLGSSYTVNGPMSEIIPSLTGRYNVFGYIPGSGMALTVITNGAKVHEAFLERYIARGRRGAVTDEDWEAYALAAGDVTLANDEKLMLPYLMDESVPLRPRGIVREGFDEGDAEANIRALHVSQALSLRLHSSHLDETEQLCVVGGGARNLLLRQLIADVFDVRTYTIGHGDLAAAFGSAVSAARTLLRISYEEAAVRYVRVDGASVVDPLGQNRTPIRSLLRRYGALENGAAEWLRP